MTITRSSAAAQKKQTKAVLVGVIRATGALLMIAGTICGLDIGGLAGSLGLADGLTEKIVGGALFAAGVVDFLLLPQFLEKKIS